MSTFIDIEKKQPLPFYDAISKQHWRRPDAFFNYKTGCILSPKNCLLPFQIKRFISADSLSYIYLCTPADLNNPDNYNYTYVNILSDIDSNDILIRSKDGYDDIMYLGKKELTSDLAEGFYFLEVSDGDNVWYSELFKVCNFEASFYQPVILTPDNREFGDVATTPTVISGGNEIPINL